MTSSLASRIGLRYAGSAGRGGERYLSFISVVSLGGMTIGVVALLVVVSVMNGFDAELKRRILGAVPHVVVAGTFADDLPGVTGRARFLEQNAMLVTGRDGHLLSLQGIDPSVPMTIAGDHMTSGRLADLAAGDGIVLGAPLAWRLGLAVDDVVTVIMPETEPGASSIRPRISRWRVVGTFELDAEPDYRLGLVNVDALARVLEKPQPDTRLRLADVLQAPAVTARLAAAGIVARDWTATYGDFFRTVRMEKTMMFVLLMLIVIIAAFNIVSSLSMMVSEKHADIAVLRTMGMTPAQVMAIFVAQGCTIGFIGIAAGAAIGLPLAIHIPEVVSFFERLAGARVLAGTYFDTVPVEVRASDVGVILVAAAVINVLSTLYPAWRASRLAPAEVLRYE